MSTFARYHKQLADCMAAFKGQELSTHAIKKHFSARNPGLDVAWVHPSDHCDNHTCKGACECARTDGAIFSKVGHGRYVVR